MPRPRGSIDSRRCCSKTKREQPSSLNVMLRVFYERQNRQPVLNWASEPSLPRRRVVHRAGRIEDRVHPPGSRWAYCDNRHARRELFRIHANAAK